MKYKKSRVDFILAIIFMFVAGGIFVWGIYFIFSNPFNLDTSGDPGTLISAYSIFITVVLFVIGIPIALFSYRTRKESKEIYDEVKNTIEPIQSHIDESKAFHEVERAYDEDPQKLWKGRGKKKLNEFSNYFCEKHSQDAQKYFFEAIDLMKDAEQKSININDVKNIDGIYEPEKLPNILTAIGYYSICEKELIYGNNKENFSRYDIYREMSNAYKSLGLRFFQHNRAIALGHLLKALEYCQKAIYDDDSYMLTYNNKSNILKDIFRICNHKDNDFMVPILKDRIKLFELNIFDFKQIGEYIHEIYIDDQSSDEDTVIKEIKKLSTGLKLNCKEKICIQCRWNCTNYVNEVEKISKNALLLLIILESITCIKKDVFNSGLKFNEEKDDKEINEQRCYYNCAISDYMLLEYSLKTLIANTALKGTDILSTDFMSNLENAMGYIEKNIDRKKYGYNIRNDYDLRSLFKVNSTEAAGAEAIGTEVGTEATGAEAIGTEVGTEATGAEATGTEVGTEATGAETTNTEAIGIEATGTERISDKNINEYLRSLRKRVECIIEKALKRK